MIPAMTGVTHHLTGKSTPGFILYAPVGGHSVYLVGYDGEVAHSWTTGHGFKYWCYLLENGNLFVNERCDNRKGVELTSSGLMREYDWDGNLVWEHLDPYQHHDARRLAGGGTAYLAYAKMDPAKQALVQGGISGSETESGLFEEVIREVDQNGALVERPYEYDSAPCRRELTDQL